MGSTKRKRLRPNEVPSVLYVAVSETVLRRAVQGRVLFRASGKPLQLFDRRSRAVRRAPRLSVVLRVSGRTAATFGSKFYSDGAAGKYEADAIPIKFSSCTKLPFAVSKLPVVDAAGGIVVAAGKRPRVLLLRKRDGRANRWVLPKGKRAPKEARRRAARREVLEESGLTRVDVGPYLLRERYFDVESGKVVFKEVSYYLMRVPKGKTQLKVNRSEGFDAGRWLPFDTALSMTNPIRAHRSLRKARAAMKPKA